MITLPAFPDHLGSEFDQNSEGEGSPQLGSKIESPIIPEKPFPSSDRSDASREEIIQGLSPKAKSQHFQEDGPIGEQDTHQNDAPSEDQRKGSHNEEDHENKQGEIDKHFNDISKVATLSHIKGSHSTYISPYFDLNAIGNLEEIQQPTTREQTTREQTTLDKDHLISSTSITQAENRRIFFVCPKARI